MKNVAVECTISSGNVFADLGLPDSAGLLAKAELVRQISRAIASRRLTQEEAARILGTTQPKVSDLLKGRLAGFSMERIIRFLIALDRDVQIVVSPKQRRSGPARFWVAGQSSRDAPPGPSKEASSVRVRARRSSPRSSGTGRRTKACS
jgi:predicted XRE-type DNA-binding protein